MGCTSSTSVTPVQEKNPNSGSKQRCSSKHSSNVSSKSKKAFEAIPTTTTTTNNDNNNNNNTQVQPSPPAAPLRYKISTTYNDHQVREEANDDTRSASSKSKLPSMFRAAQHRKQTYQTRRGQQNNTAASRGPPVHGGFTYATGPGGGLQRCESVTDSRGSLTSLLEAMEKNGEMLVHSDVDDTVGAIDTCGVETCCGSQEGERCIGGVVNCHRYARAMLLGDILSLFDVAEITRIITAEKDPYEREFLARSFRIRDKMLQQSSTLFNPDLYHTHRLTFGGVICNSRTVLSATAQRRVHAWLDRETVPPVPVLMQLDVSRAGSVSTSASPRASRIARWMPPPSSPSPATQYLDTSMGTNNNNNNVELPELSSINVHENHEMIMAEIRANVSIGGGGVMIGPAKHNIGHGGVRKSARPPTTTASPASGCVFARPTQCDEQMENADGEHNINININLPPHSHQQHQQHHQHRHHDQSKDRFRLEGPVLFGEVAGDNSTNGAGRDYEDDDELEGSSTVLPASSRM
eukprot:PhM_4_TR18817/c1_g1_i2/m.35830